ncbi:MAG: C4-dicarboxylate ABC transporter permease [Desulfobacteraceae bacterium 4572_35.2]|nr:MAG: C4-dicarboxylate ABC transporter permease [Desulfobacteraceae bacterium 4572_35.2]
MSLFTLGIIGIIVLLVVIFALRVPVGFAMAIVGFIGFWKVVNLPAAMGMVGAESWKVFSSYGLTVIPLFVLMGQICFHSGVNERLYKAAHVWMGGVRGGLAVATILACAGFAAICGSNTATAATMSSVALPQMKKYGYSPLLSTGSVAVGATLGVVIPPSVVLILIGLQTGQSIASLFWAGLVPGALLTGLFLLTVLVSCLFRPELGPAGGKTSWREKMAALPGAIEMLVLFALVMVGLLLGFFTPSEAGAAGSALALLISVVGGHMSWRKFVCAVDDSLRISCMIMMIIFGAVVFGRFLTITRLPYQVAEQVSQADLSPIIIITLICIIYAIGGAIMDALALLIITIPIFFPVAQQLGYDPLWFAVLITVVTTMGAVTPPVGVNTFIVASMAKDVPLGQVFRGVSLFLPSFFLCLFVLIVWPQLVLWLPNWLN